MKTLIRLISFIILFFPQITHAEIIQVEYSYAEKSASITFSWESLTSSYFINRQEITIEFNQEIKLDLSKAFQEGTAWFSNIVPGYDSIFIKVHPHISFKISSEDQSLKISMFPKEQQQSEKPKISADMGLLRVRLFIKRGKVEDALKLLEQLMKDYPEHIGVLVTRADLENQVGRTGNAIKLLEQAEKFAPENRDIIKFKETLLASLNRYVYGETIFKETLSLSSKVQQLETRVRILRHQTLKPGEEIEGIIEFIDYHVYEPESAFDKQVQASSPKYRAEVRIEKDRPPHNKLEIAGYLNGKHLGVGSKYAWLDLKGETALRAEYQYPYWDMIQSVIEDGTRDRVRGERRHRFHPRLNGNIGVGINRYQFQDKFDRFNSVLEDQGQKSTYPSYWYDGLKNAYYATTFSSDGGFNYVLPPYWYYGLGKNAFISLGYGYILEIPLLEEKESPDADSLFENHNHTLTLALSKTFSDRWRASSHVSYTYNFLGVDTRACGLAIYHQRTNDLEFNLRFNCSVSDSITREIAAGIKYLF